MTTIIISKAWYEDVEDLVKMEEPFFFTECGWDKVEVDVDEEEFDRVSAERGWI